MGTCKSVTMLHGATCVPVCNKGYTLGASNDAVSVDAKNMDYSLRSATGYIDGVLVTQCAFGTLSTPICSPAGDLNVSNTYWQCDRRLKDVRASSLLNRVRVRVWTPGQVVPKYVWCFTWLESNTKFHNVCTTMSLSEPCPYLNHVLI